MGRASSETTTLVCAVSLAVALGVACGFWVNARLASAASIASPAPAHLLPVAGATVQETPATSAVTEPRPAVYHDASSTPDEIPPSHGYVEPRATELSGTNSTATTDEEGAVKRRAAVVAPVASEESRRAKPDGRPGDVPDAGKKAPDVGKKATVGQGRALPCGLYASMGSLTIRHGGAASLVLGGPGEAGRVTVTTPDWSDIAVFSEGRTGGNGWMRYSVRSISKRAGVYTVRFTTPCGSKTIPVTVTRP